MKPIHSQRSLQEGKTPPASSIRCRAASEFGLIELINPTGLKAQFLPNGALFALRHRETMLNQLLPGPAEDGLFRLMLRWHHAGVVGGAVSLVGPGLAWGADPASACWVANDPAGRFTCITTFRLHAAYSAWAWHVVIRNRGDHMLSLDALHAQDLGLGDVGAVRNNEAYNSQYLDLQAVSDEALGYVLLARQNQPMAGGRRPWLAFACVQGASGYCTDGWQFFGADHRVTNKPAAARELSLPSQRLQYEFALAGLQSRPVELAPGESTEFTFVARFLEDHPGASAPSDLAQIHDLLPASWATGRPVAVSPAVQSSVFTRGGWLHGTPPSASKLAAWFPDPHRHKEYSAGGRLLSFFSGNDTHVVCREKETAIARPHGHILRSGTATWNDNEQFGLTCYAAGIFGAQAYLGNPSLARLLSVVRNQLNVTRASGQRIFIRRGSGWGQLGVPSVFAMEPGAVRWLYQIGKRVIEVRVWCSGRNPASFLELKILSGPPARFLITHQLALGSHELDSPVELEIHVDGWIAASAATGGFTAQHLPETCFALAAVTAGDFDAYGGDEFLYTDRRARQGPYAAFQSKMVGSFALILLGSSKGLAALSSAVTRAREDFGDYPSRAQPPTSPVQCQGSNDAGVARLNEILPWFTHNAGIHFSAPHGLEQYGGAAWGVRDVCQGSVEWLLAAGEFRTVRRILMTVFEQQYAPHSTDAAIAGGWPQWFMFAPFRFIQQTHSHGDVCFWPLKALCDYIEASNDLDFLQTSLNYTDAVHFTAVGPAESVWAHCDRVVAQIESRFVPGTALVNYGDGDWDDTLQPADPAMRTRMISVWTVALAFHTFRQLAEVSRRSGELARAAHLAELLIRIRHDFVAHAMPGGITAGFLVHESDNSMRPLLHPSDRVTGIRYRLLPMTRSVLAELFTPEEAFRHAAIIEKELRFTDGVRLMSEPATYQDGLERLFKRADTAANVGREVGLQYVHAHIRYAEAMAKLGDATRLWQALQIVNPVGLTQVLPTAMPRQSNVYFSSSDADFADRKEAAARWLELRNGQVGVRGGWRLYSSGPGLYLNKVRSCLFGVRESFGDIIFDPVLPHRLDGLIVDTRLFGLPVQIEYRVKSAPGPVAMVTVNGTELTGLSREINPYRIGGLRAVGSVLVSLLRPEGNSIILEL